MHGRVKFAKGKPYRIRDGERTILKKGNDVRDGDEIVMRSKKDLLIVNFGNDYKSTMKLTENTTVSFPKANKKERKTSMNMKIGNAIVEYLDAKERNFEVKTETAAMAVRGTKWGMNVGNKGTAVFVERGRVDVTSVKTGVRNRVVGGKYTVVRRNGATIKPRKFDKSAFNFSTNAAQEPVRNEPGAEKVLNEMYESVPVGKDIPSAGGVDKRSAPGNSEAKENKGSGSKIDKPPGVDVKPKKNGLEFDRRNRRRRSNRERRQEMKEKTGSAEKFNQFKQQHGAPPNGDPTTGEGPQ